MKRALSLFLALTLCLSLCFGLSACGGKGTKLTLDNYDDYLKIRPYIVLPHDIACNSAHSFTAIDGAGCMVEDYSSYICIGVKVEGISENFSYSDITLEVKATGRYMAVDPNNTSTSLKTVTLTQTLSQYIECKLDISGNGTGKSTGKASVPNGLVIPYHSFHSSTDFSFEIVKISGTVSPA